MMGCSTFEIGAGATRLVGHNMDALLPGTVPAWVCSNPRGEVRRGVSLAELLGRAPAPAEPLEWRSRYGSVTVALWGRGFIDGGLNEAGLYVQEMTLPDSVYPDADGRPTVFTMRWLQRLLDLHATVDDVLVSLDDVAIDGWPWHFFLSDATGTRASVGFTADGPVIHTGDSMPVALLCNTAYGTAFEELSQHEGFGGAIALDQDRPALEVSNPALLQRVLDLAAGRDDAMVWQITMASEVATQEELAAMTVDRRHLIGAARLASLDEDTSAEDALALARYLSPLDAARQLTYVIDVPAGRLWLEAKGSELRSADLTTIDLSDGARPLVLDIHSAGRGDVTDHFEAWSRERDAAMTAAAFELWSDPIIALLGGDTGTAVRQRIADHTDLELRQRLVAT